MRIFNSTDILVPNTDLTKWSVVACDQYTSQNDYWSEIEKNVGDFPSAYRIIYPEIFLGEENGEERIKNINVTMQKYLDEGLFNNYENALILVERKQRDGRVRYGIMGTIDLEEYNYNAGSESAVRATEGTVLERIPPRVKIRENAALEMPHILMLIDDDARTVVEPVRDIRATLEKIYDFDLVMDSGHLTGYLIKDTEAVLKAVEELGNREKFVNKYKTEKSTLQFAVGDGNHSLATAKACWEKVKSGLTSGQQKTHPARYALVELMNVHDEALEFEAIHRVVFDVEPEKLINDMLDFFPGASLESGTGQMIEYCCGNKSGKIYIPNPPSKLAVGTLGQFLDSYVAKRGGKIDYIHGADVTRQLSSADNTIGFILPSMEKGQLFEAVIFDGALPRKTFSMGEAHDKKFYLECKIIK